MSLPDPNLQDQPIPDPAVSKKRAHSDTASPIEQSCSNEVTPICSTPSTETMPPPDNAPITIQRSNTEKKKKLRTNPISESFLSDEAKSIVREAYQKATEPYLLPVDHFLAFLDNTYNSKSPYHEALRFTSDIKSLLSDMYAMYPSLRTRSLKNRFTRLAKKLKEHFKDEDMEIESLPSEKSIGFTDLSDEEYPSDAVQISQHS